MIRLHPDDIAAIAAQVAALMAAPASVVPDVVAAPGSFMARMQQGREILASKMAKGASDGVKRKPRSKRAA